MKYKSLIITGPTASGKSDFAHKLAKRINGAIINCDSVQIYRGIETVSASPFAENTQNGFDEIDGVPYRLFSILSLDEHISVADYLALATKTMDEVIKMGKTPIFVGGSGYYINVLINGISPIPEVSIENRIRAREIVKQNPQAAHELLPEDFEKTDPQRTARALEVFLETGTPLSQWQKMPRRGAILKDAYKILIMPNRSTLIERIEKRIPEMISGAGIKEARYVMANKLAEDRAIGITQLCQMLRGECSELAATESWAVKTKQYAKRQCTWFQGQYTPDYTIPHVPIDEDLEFLIKKIS